MGPDNSATGPRSEPVYLDTNGYEFFSLSGTSGCGKSTTLGDIIEAHALPMDNISVLRRGRCVVVFVLHNNNREILAGIRPTPTPGRSRSCSPCTAQGPWPCPTSASAGRAQNRASVGG